MDRSLQRFGRKIESISQIFDILVRTTFQCTIVILILVFLSSICLVLDAAFDLFARRHRQKMLEIT